MKRFILTAITAIAIGISTSVYACTGISLTPKSGGLVLSRTIEWGSGEMISNYVIVPRGHCGVSFTPDGGSGLKYTARYGYVGLSIEKEEFVVEGINEKGLSAGLFYFPGYGKYQDYNKSISDKSVTDLQLVSWMLSQFSSVEEVISNFNNIVVIGIDPRASTVHWRIADNTGREVVLEIVNGKANFYENKLGVLTNSPNFQWQLTNLNNYVNLLPGTVIENTMKNYSMHSFGAGSSALGLPGDVTPPSRFVRAAFYKLTAPILDTTEETVMECFHIMNNFDIPIGIEFAKGEQVPNIPSATQWTTVTDVKNKVIYYRTMYNSTIRRIDLNKIDFNHCKYRVSPLDTNKSEKIQDLV